MDKLARAWKIYCLIDPLTEQIRYVGWAFDVPRRLLAHMNRAKQERTHKANWLNGLAAQGLRPIAKVLEQGTESWAEAEVRWIATYREQGHPLTNLTTGGEGCVGLVPSLEAREKMAVAKRGKKRTPEAIKKCADANRGKKRTPEVAARMAAARVNRAHTPETKAKIAATVTGFRHTPEAKAKIAAAGQGRFVSEETKAKIREKHLGKTLSVEHRRKLSEAKQGRTLTEGHKAKIQAASGGWHHTEETKAKISAARKKG